MAAVVAPVRDLDVRIAILLYRLLGAGLEAGGQVDRRRLEEGRCLLLRAWLRENRPGLVAHDHPAHRTSRKTPRLHFAQMLVRTRPATGHCLRRSAVWAATTVPPRAATCPHATHHAG